MPQKIHDVFGPGSNTVERIVRDYQTIEARVQSARGLGMKIVLTSGTFDIFHEGHARYLEQARSRGDLLIVGVDSDEKVRRRKGENRPVVGEDERMEILCHSRHVDLVFLKGADDLRWQLIRTVHPDVLIATRETYMEDDLVALKEICGEVVVLEPQAATSTTARIRKLVIGAVAQMRVKLAEVMEFLEELERGKG